ncbi:hypothetical protein ACWC9T_05195 [Kitasatospora sp. NPDC001159]
MVHCTEEFVAGTRAALGAAEAAGARRALLIAQSVVRLRAGVRRDVHRGAVPPGGGGGGAVAPGGDRGHDGMDRARPGAEP